MFFERAKPRLSGAPAERSERAMGTRLCQRVYGIGGARSCALASAEVARLEQLWSVFILDSEITRLSRNAGYAPVAIHDDTLAVLAQAKQLFTLTSGALDVTAGPLVQLWRDAARRGSSPSGDELAVARALVDGRDLVLGPARSARLCRTGQSVDLGAIGKGYAADRCVQLYEESGVRHALVDFGGNVVALGVRPEGTPWRVGIQAPGRPRGESFGYVEARDCSIVTSGSYERFFEVAGKKHSHIIDPRSGMPVSHGLVSATVMADSSAFADGMATACMVLGTQSSLALARQHHFEVLLLDERGVHTTPGIARVFHAA